MSFIPDRSVVDYTQLFTATSMMPSHVIADQLKVDVTAALLGNNIQLVHEIAKLWNTIWDLKPGVDLKRFPSSGPYKIESILDGGAVVLAANDRWWGPKPVTKRITVSAAGRRHPGPGQQPQRRRGRRRGRVVGIAGHPGQLRARRFAVGRHRAADLRAAGTAGAGRKPAARWRCVRRAT